MAKFYKFQGEQFEVSAPKNCVITVTGMGLTGHITIHEATGMYREDLDGWGTDQPTLDSALQSCCNRIIERAKKSSKEELCKGMDDFYESLEE